jgi:peroxiredoxin
MLCVLKRSDSIIVAVITVLVAALVYVVSGTLETPVIKAGDRAPAFTIVTDQGRTISPSRFDGKLLVLNFWATWCAGCVQEITSLNAFQKKFASRGVVVVGVSMDANERTYKQFLQRFNIIFATTRDPGWDLSASYGTFQLPETYLINPSGLVLEKIVAAYNFMDPAFLMRVEQLL